jgi:hypothetical protein
MLERHLVHHAAPLRGVPTTASRAEATVVSVSFDAHSPAHITEPVLRHTLLGLVAKRLWVMPLGFRL